jgi:hypothetical protein
MPGAARSFGVGSRQGAAKPLRRWIGMAVENENIHEWNYDVRALAVFALPQNRFCD